MKSLIKTVEPMKMIKNLLVAIIIPATILLAFGLQAAADVSGVTLVLKPPQCVALHQGQECFVNIELTWNAEKQGDYCLFSSLQNQALQCWQNKQQSVFEREMLATENIVFSIRAKGESVILASTALEMVWVYKKSSRSHLAWRLF